MTSKYYSMFVPAEKKCYWIDVIIALPSLDDAE